MKKNSRVHRVQGSSRTKRTVFYTLLIGIVWVSLVLLTGLGLGEAIYGRQLQEGDIALQSIYAPFNFSVKGEIDEEKTKTLQKETIKSVKPVYDLNLSQEKQKIDKIDQLIQIIAEVEKIQEVTLVEKVNQFSEKLKTIELILSLNSTETLLQEIALQDWAQKLKQSLDELLKVGILTVSEKKKLQETNREEMIVRDLQKNQEVAKTVSELIHLDESKPKIEYIVYDHFPESRKSRTAAIELLSQLIVPTLIYNDEETEKRKKLAVEAIEPVYQLTQIKKNELIVTKGQKINRKHLMILKTLEQESSLTTKVENTLGIMLLVSLLIAIFVLYLIRYDHKLLKEPSHLILLSAIVVSTMGLAKAVTLSPFSSFLIPIPMASMLAAILLNTSTGIMITLFLSLLSASMVAQKFGLVLVMVLSGLTAVYSVNRIHRRFDILRAGVWAGVTAMGGVLIVSLISGLQIKVSFNEATWGLLNGLLSAVIVMGVLPAFEAIFNITTNPSLLELSDLNHPILRQLAIHAPGTYHHSLVVGNLAESACEAMGANALLARVGAYYHDIGKMEKAEYFTENQMDFASKHRHEKLSPHMSSLIIVNHIKNGIELAKQYKLPNRIIDFIPEHQGSSLIYFFYQKALQQIKEGETIKEEDFRYPGPKPQSKETAVVLLADSVEASSRSLTDPTPARIRGLVRKTINNKFIDGQLDECNLTFSDLNTISETFVRVLTGTFHTRVSYPEPQESQANRGNQRGMNVHNKDKKQSESGQGRSKENQTDG